MTLETFYAKATQTDDRTVAQKVRIIQQPQIHNEWRPNCRSNCSSLYFWKGLKVALNGLHILTATSISEET